jgi:hypothetical protein
MINSRADNGLDDDIADVQSEIEEFIEEWNKYARMSEDEKKTFYFGRRFMVQPPSAEIRRLLKPYNSGGKDAARETLTSMRNVDAQVFGEIVIWEEK